MPIERLRVLVTGLPPMLDAILKRAMEQDNTIEMHWADTADTLATSIDRWRPDVLLAPCLDTALLYGAPRLQVYVLNADASGVRHLSLHPVAHELGDLSLAGLVAAIKQRPAAG